MASKQSVNKRVAKKAVKAAKKHTGLVVAIVIILVLVIAACVVAYFKVPAFHDFVDSFLHRGEPTEEVGGGSGSGGGTVPQATT